MNLTEGMRSLFKQSRTLTANGRKAIMEERQAFADALQIHRQVLEQQLESHGFSRVNPIDIAPLKIVGSSLKRFAAFRTAPEMRGGTKVFERDSGRGTEYIYIIAFYTAESITSRMIEPRTDIRVGVNLTRWNTHEKSQEGEVPLQDYVNGHESAKFIEELLGPFGGRQTRSQNNKVTAINAARL